MSIFYFKINFKNVCVVPYKFDRLSIIMRLSWLIGVFKIISAQNVFECKEKYFSMDIMNTTGTIVSQPAPYSTYASSQICNITLKLPGYRYLLEFNEFNVECSYDFLSIFDGNRDAPSAYLTGKVVGSNMKKYLSSSDNVLISFKSDSYIQSTGFNIKFTAIPSNTSGLCLDCNGRGVCVNNECKCNNSYYGNLCQFGMLVLTLFSLIKIRNYHSNPFSSETRACRSLQQSIGYNDIIFWSYVFKKHFERLVSVQLHQQYLEKH